ncbi:type I restriction enzyme M protein [Atopostipes suicloacalis DSM 15692]|uniref:site-specific DNA-methyltransferase (adenine-specific) n=1 Tax=Atopostipes suicloacalis DSM 15692 TaxID=1121025 RepID=A0A1M4ZFK4_9LACT|nr:type I restriction-modification system subunit M [Atopostipes suicloacalis]SHF16800.1 type I restriction enzyme M protein [Atopostipes suicloacalis DSM 15692]
MAQKSTTLAQALWNSADELRSHMDANEYKNYLLGLVFYKYLSDHLLYKAAELLEEEPKNLEEAQKIYEENFNNDAIRDILLSELQNTYGYTLEPHETYTAIIEKINNRTFELVELEQAFRDIEQSDKIYLGLFNDVDLQSTRLGPNPQKRNDRISAVMQRLEQVDLTEYGGDALGDAYEYLIGQFASESGKKAGEFYTPQAVSNLMTKIAILGKEDKRGLTVYDPTMGSGSLLLNAKAYSNQPNLIYYFGQEVNTTTLNLARMNMILHNVGIGQQKFRNGDTLDDDWPTDEPTNFDMVLMNPPYSAKWSASNAFLEDSRFAPYGKLPPKSRADFAFLLHGYYHLRTDGTMAIVLPHGVLFRSGAEATIRQNLLENGAIDTVIGLPENLFFNTSIPTTIIILKKDRDNRDVLFIDASKEFKKIRNQNEMDEGHIEKIIETYKNREFVDKFAYVAEFDEIVENDYNLNIPRYVDTFEEPEPIDVVQLSKDIQEIDKELEKNKKEFLGMMDELQVTEENKEIIDAIKAVFQ